MPKVTDGELMPDGSHEQNKGNKYGTERATEGERIMIASNLGIFVVFVKLTVMAGVYMENRTLFLAF